MLLQVLCIGSVVATTWVNDTGSGDTRTYTQDDCYSSHPPPWARIKNVHPPSVLREYLKWVCSSNEEVWWYCIFWWVHPQAFCYNSYHILDYGQWGWERVDTSNMVIARNDRRILCWKTKHILWFEHIFDTTLKTRIEWVAPLLKKAGVTLDQTTSLVPRS